METKLRTFKSRVTPEEAYEDYINMLHKEENFKLMQVAIIEKKYIELTELVKEFPNVDLYSLPLLIELAAKNHNIKAIDILLKPSFELFASILLGYEYKEYYPKSVLAWKYMFETIINSNVEVILRKIKSHFDFSKVRAARDGLILALLQLKPNFSLKNLHLLTLKDMLQFIEKNEVNSNDFYHVFTLLFSWRDISKFINLLEDNREKIPNFSDIQHTFYLRTDIE